MDPFGYYAEGIQQGLDDAFKQRGTRRHGPRRPDGGATPPPGSRPRQAPPALRGAPQTLREPRRRARGAEPRCGARGAAGVPAPSSQGQAAVRARRRREAHGKWRGARGGRGRGGGVSRTKSRRAAPATAHVERRSRTQPRCGTCMPPVGLRRRALDRQPILQWQRLYYCAVLDASNGRCAAQLHAEDAAFALTAKRGTAVRRQPALPPRSYRLRLPECAGGRGAVAGVLAKDAFLVFRALCKLSIRTATPPRAPTSTAAARQGARAQC